MKFEAEKNELETSREAAREALATEVSVTQELTKKLSAKRDEALEQRNLADKFKRELEQLRSELRNLKNENESWIRKAEARMELSEDRATNRRTCQKFPQSFPQQQQQQQQQNEQQKETDDDDDDDDSANSSNRNNNNQLVSRASRGRRVENERKSRVPREQV